MPEEDQLPHRLIVSVEELLQYAEASAKTVYVEDGFIVLKVKADAPYEIGLDRCNTAEKTLEWVVHLCGKTWVTRDVLRSFIYHAATQNRFQIHLGA